MFAITIISFLFFTALVAFGTWLIVRNKESGSRDGFFLAGRSLTFPVIAGSLLLTNLSTEQMVGLNGSAFKEGMSVMAWEVMAVVALVFMAIWFLPKFLKVGVTTVPEYLEHRFDRTTAGICNLIFLIAYVLLLLPIILYTGARGMLDILDLSSILGIQNEMAQLYTLVTAVALIGGAYALFGGLRSCAVSDTLNGIGLLIGGLLIAWLAFDMLSPGSFVQDLDKFVEAGGNRINSIGANDSEAPFFALFTGVFLIHAFYWCTNQQIIQRTFGAKSLAEGQKGVLLTGLLKLIGPLFLVIPGMIAAILYCDGRLNIPLDPNSGLAASDKAFGSLVNLVLPAPLKGFFAAVLLGAVLSSFNSVLNSICTLFSINFYKPYINPAADDRKLVRIGQYFGFAVMIISIIVAPMLSSAGSIYNYLQNMNAMTFIPLLGVVFIAMFTKKVPAVAAKTTLIAGIALNAIGYFVPPFNSWVKVIGNYHFVTLVFVLMLAAMLVWSMVAPQPVPFEEKDAGVTDLTPWKYRTPAAIALLVIVALIYICFADFSVLSKGKPEYPTIQKKAVPENPAAEQKE